MIKILLITISLFVLLFLESFLSELFSFSLFILIVLLLRKRIHPIAFYIFITLFGVILDSVTHFPLGTHVLVIAILLVFLDFLSLVVPSEGNTQYVGIFLSIFLYYILLLVLGSLLQDGVFPKVAGDNLANIFIISTISTLLCNLVNRFLKTIQYDNSKGSLTLG